ncbi:hypothetical protein AAFF_G00440670 [Aldrovandia affinis]|uniref:DUF4430 domain-containing protein n=1 Tax=Aldrovandia affinis TaxID=143900 RepID=A0AAD7S7H9_9TELE|nr:hypothetical protein AAFF_G00440670 [Aldrovandia affinis]
MRTLQDSTDFKFVVKEDHNYGPFLVSVNGVAGRTEDRTYWELLAEFKNGTTFRPDVGVGCFIPFPQQRVILKFTKY